MGEPNADAAETAGLRLILLLKQIGGKTRSDFGDNFDFDEQIARQAGDFNRGARGKGFAVGSEVGRVDRIHRREIVHVLEKDCSLDHLAKTAAAGLENSLEIIEGSRRLFLDSAGYNLTGDGIQTTLTGSEDEVSYTHALRIRADRGWRAVGGDIRATHGSIL